jgi:hypothetical protein
VSGKGRRGEAGFGPVVQLELALGSTIADRLKAPRDLPGRLSQAQVVLFGKGGMVVKSMSSW